MNDRLSRSAAGSSRTNRRTFLGDVAISALAAVPTIVSARALGLEARAAAAGERITLGVVGFGPRCKYVLGEMLKFPDVQCVAIADVQAVQRNAGKAFVDDHYGTADCRVFRDMRELLARPDIDCVLIATGDRWHGKAATMAAEAGKDVYCEKPCGLTIDVCRCIAETMQSTGRIFQAGTQRRSVPNFIRVKELVREGKIGGLKEMYASVYMPSLNNDWLPAQPSPDPEQCDWNVWLGPAPWRPYNAGYLGRGWRGVYDFEAGARLLDWGVHTVDLCQWVKGADGTGPVEYTPSDTGIVCRYADGVTLTLQFLADPFKDRGPQFNTQLGTCPVRFVGTEGWISTGDAGLIDVEPTALAAELPDAVKRVKGTDAAAHARNFFDSVKTRQAPVCNADVMRRSHVVAHAAANSWILGRSLGFDPATETFTSGGRPDVEANGLRSRPERQVWA
jgi:predicted dehydrogenase